MADLTQRPFSDPSELLLMAALAGSLSGEHLHTSDLPYRFSSWAMDAPENIALWLDAAGQLTAWAVLQAPFWSIDFACQPASVLPVILDWAEQRIQAVAGSPYERPAWFVNVFRRQEERIHALESAGFTSQDKVEVDPWSKVLLRSDLAQPVAPSRLPEGFSLRPLAGKAEVDAYVQLHRAVFETKTMTSAWRARTLQQPGYRPDLDIVIQAPDGRLAAFCIGWFDAQGRDGAPCGQIEPLGVHPDFRGRGLAKVIIADVLRRMQAMGARQAFVETDNFRDAAFALYQSAGFAVIEDVLVFRKDR